MLQHLAPLPRGSRSVPTAPRAFRQRIENTLGGMLGKNSCGPHSVMGGETVDSVIGLDVLTYRGTRMRVGAVSDERMAGGK